MLLEQKVNWRAQISQTILELRAHLLKKIRQFFQDRDILEVETPLLSQYTVTDPYIESFKVKDPHTGLFFYLQTSPEYAMKRLLAAEGKAIYQISKAFRQSEQGRYHNPEFTMIEWYRPHFTEEMLRAEVDVFLQEIVHTQAADHISYEALFCKHCQLHPFESKLSELQKLAQAVSLKEFTEDRDFLLQFLFNQIIEPQLGFEKPIFVYHYPATQAALANLHPTNANVALRFEAYSQGIELVNGFHEVTRAEELRKRFHADNLKRQLLNLPTIPIDERFVTACPYLPPCAGVAVGFDRLVLLSAKTQQIQNVIAFPWDIA